MRPALPHSPLLMRLAGLGCALAAIGCQPIQQIIHPTQPVAAVPPVAVVQPVGPPVFVAPPAISGEGVLVDPFAADPYVADPAAIPPATAPMLPPGDGGSSRIVVPVVNRDWTWEQIVDVVDDYFRIEHERQVQLVGDVLTEGRIDAFPQIGATLVEPHRRDSVGRYNRWESTLQTIRRRACVRVIPDAGGYLVDITVEKDLEDLPRPEFSTAGAVVFRHDNSLPTDSDVVSRTQLAGRWILIGRDPPLEQRMLAEIQARLAPQPATAP